MPAHTEDTASDGATKETDRSPDSPTNAAVQEGNPTATKSAKAGAKTEKLEATPEEKAEQRRKRAYRWKIVIGLFAPFTLQSLDTTIIASALPFIASDFNQLSQLNWIISVFNLTSAAFLPFWAQIADIFGRHATIQTTIILMMIGSAICTGAPTNAFGVLLLGRAIQGVGAAGVNISVRVILADKVSLADYAINWTVFALFSGLGFSVGPVIGGYLTRASWRWCFAINLPVGVLAIVLVVVVLRRELLGPQPIPELEGEGNEGAGQDRAAVGWRTRLGARLMTLDYVGQLLFLFGLGLLILAFTWAGGTYGWGSAAVVAPLVIGAVLSVAWVLYEYSMAPPHLMSRVFRKQRAMMPWELLSKRDICLLFFVNFDLGVAMFAVMYFMDLYFALVEGHSSSEAGLALLYYLPGLGAGAYSAMFCVNVWPRQTLHPLLLGAITSSVGITVLAWAISAQQTNTIYGMMALTGYGVGIRLSPASMHGLAYFPASTAAITSLFSFAIPFGGMIALTTMSTVFNNKSEADPKDGITWAFVSMIPFVWLCLILTTFLGNVWVRKEGDHEVVNGAYFWSLFTRKTLQKERRMRDGAGWGNGAISRTDTQTVVTGERRRDAQEV
ncbi:major facilitator superfamily domain-containing protein [Diaporthe sp. PMI_573]|nr:major facilitator superfamily domain-containing protein [Diaporthaceae sp. PMI_573]